MKKLSLKLFLITILTFILFAFINIFLRLFFYRFLNMKEFISDYFYILSIITAFGTFTLFFYCTKLVLIDRINALNNSIKEVTKGNYTPSIDIIGKDEISTLTENFNLMIQELNSNEYLNKEFIRNYSHEIKTPLSIIKGFAELMNNNDIDEQTIKSYSKIILEESSRLLSTSTQILTLSKLDSSKILKIDDEVEIDKQIVKIILHLQKIWQEKEIEFNVNIQKVKILSNEELIYLVWMNLISNAIKYSHLKGIIDVNLFVDETIRFEIKDNGIGISQENLNKITQPFFTNNYTNAEKSTGLGLTIVNKIIMKLNGSFTYHSIEKKGSTFIIELDKKYLIDE